MKKTTKPASTDSLDDLLPPIPSSSTPAPTELEDETDELLESLPDLPDSAATSSPQVPSSAPATRAATSSTAPRDRASPTLSILSAPPPRTVCNGCQAGVWMLTEQGDLRVYCRLMYRNIEETLLACDGKTIAAQAMH